MPLGWFYRLHASDKVKRLVREAGSVDPPAVVEAFQMKPSGRQVTALASYLLFDSDSASHYRYAT